MMMMSGTSVSGAYMDKGENNMWHEVMTMIQIQRMGVHVA